MKLYALFACCYCLCSLTLNSFFYHHRWICLQITFGYLYTVFHIKSVFDSGNHKDSSHSVHSTVTTGTTGTVLKEKEERDTNEKKGRDTKEKEERSANEKEGRAVNERKLSNGTVAALIFSISCGTLAFVAEHILIRTQLFPFEHLEGLGPKICGTVPIFLVLCWTCVLYQGFSLTNIIVSGTPKFTYLSFIGSSYTKKSELSSSESRKVMSVGSILSLCITSLISSLIVTAWDMAIDPYFVDRGLWTYDPSKGDDGKIISKELSNVNTGHNFFGNGNAFLGIPILNFIGWLYLAFVINVLVRGFIPHVKKCHDKQSRLEESEIRSLIIWEIAMYVCSGLQFVIALESSMECRLIAFFATAIPVSIASHRVLSSESSYHHHHHHHHKGNTKEN